MDVLRRRVSCPSFVSFRSFWFFSSYTLYRSSTPRTSSVVKSTVIESTALKSTAIQFTAESPAVESTANISNLSNWLTGHQRAVSSTDDKSWCVQRAIWATVCDALPTDSRVFAMRFFLRAVSQRFPVDRRPIYMVTGADDINEQNDLKKTFDHLVLLRWRTSSLVRRIICWLVDRFYPWTVTDDVCSRLNQKTKITVETCLTRFNSSGVLTP